MANIMADSSGMFEQSLLERDNANYSSFALNSQSQTSDPVNIHRTDYRTIFDRMWQKPDNGLASSVNVGFSRNESSSSSSSSSFACSSSGSKNFWLKAAIEAKNRSLANAFAAASPSSQLIGPGVVT